MNADDESDRVKLLCGCIPICSHHHQHRYHQIPRRLLTYDEICAILLNICLILNGCNFLYILNEFVKIFNAHLHHTVRDEY